VGPLKHFSSIQRAYPVYPIWYMINLAVGSYRAKLEATPVPAEVLARDFGAQPVTAQEVLDLGLVQDGASYGYSQLLNCQNGEGFSQTGLPYIAQTPVWLPNYAGQSPTYCDFEWQVDRIGVDEAAMSFMVMCGEEPCQADQLARNQWGGVQPHVFEVEFGQIWFEDGYAFPCPIAKDSELIEFDSVNFQLPGIYNVTYDLSDDFNNTADTVSRTVTVKDTTPPVLHLVGEPLMILRYGEAFMDPGATATDTGDDYYYNLNRVNISACGYDTCTPERDDAAISNKIVTRVHKETIGCAREPLYPFRNSTPPICRQARAGQTATISCPIDGTVISGYTFLSYGQPEGICGNSMEPLTASLTCNFQLDEEIGETVPADVAMFNAQCLGKQVHRPGHYLTARTSVALACVSV
jgi:hypothetical protein